MQGIEPHDLGAGGHQQLAGLGIPEAEGGAAGHRDPGGSRRPRAGLTYFDRRIPGLDIEIRCGSRKLDHGVEVEILLRHQRQRRDGLQGCRLAFGHPDQAQVTARHDHRGQPRDDPQNRHSGLGDTVAGLSLMAWRADVVQDHAGHPDRVVEPREAVDDGADAAGDSGAVDHEHHRRLDESGHVGAGGEATRSGGAVEQAHDALDDRDVRHPGGERCVHQ